MALRINERYERGFVSQIDAAMAGEVTHIPVHLDRVGNVFNLMQSRYILLAGSTGSGKTAWADYTGVLTPWTMFNREDTDIHWECVYFSLERKQMFKHAKWMSWFLYRDHGFQTSADQILGWTGERMTPEQYAMIRSYDKEMSDLLEHVTIYDSKVSASVVTKAIEARALDLGTHYHSDEDFVFKKGETLALANFEVDGKDEYTKTGIRRYVQLEHEGKPFKIYQHDNQYFLKNPKTFVFVIVDGINLFGSKETIDEVSVVLANARDIYGFSPLVITQQNRALGDVQRMKLHGADLSPQLEDIFKSSQMGFDADLVLGLFDPYRYKAFDSSGKYGGYYIKSMDVGQPYSMIAPSGHSRFRSLHVLKNSFGIDGAVFGMKFLGECNHFEVLPKPQDEAMMIQEYQKIAQGL